MSLRVEQLFESNVGVSSTAVRAVRAYRVEVDVPVKDAENLLALAQTPAASPDRIPTIGTPFDDSNLNLLAETIDGRMVTPWVAEFTVYYSTPRVRLNNTGNLPRVNLDLSTVSQRVFTDLDNKVIGDVSNILNEFGVDVQVPQVTLEVDMPEPWPLNATLIVNLLTKVNSVPIFGLDPGLVQFIGASARWIGPGDLDYKVVYHFTAGKGYVQDPGGDGEPPALLEVFMDNAVQWTQKKLTQNPVDGGPFIRPDTGQPYFTVVPDRPIIYRIYERADLNLLLQGP